MGDTCEMRRAENPQCSGRQEGDKSKTSMKSREPEHSEHPGHTGRQVETSKSKVQWRKWNASGRQA